MHGFEIVQINKLRATFLPLINKLITAFSDLATKNNYQKLCTGDKNIQEV